MQLPVIVERNAWTLPQERYNAEWVRENGVGMVLPNFRGIARAVDRLLEPAAYERFRDATARCRIARCLRFQTFWSGLGCDKLIESMQGDLIGLWLLSKGLMAGLAIAVPVGPVNVLCASRTLSKGRLSGLMSGFGAATADALYGAIAGFSITYRHRISGARGVLDPRVRRHAADGDRRDRTFANLRRNRVESEETTATTFRLRFHAAAHADQSHDRAFLYGGAGRARHGRAAPMVADIPAGGQASFAGRCSGGSSWSCWSTGFATASMSEAMRWMNRIAGLAIGGFGVVTFLIGIRTDAN